MPGSNIIEFTGCLWLTLLATTSVALSEPPATALAFAPDDSLLASGGSRQIHLRSAKDGKILRSIACNLPKVRSVLFSQDSQFLIVGGGEPGVRGEAQIFSITNSAPPRRIGDHTDLVNAVANSVDGQSLGIASSDHTARVWKWNGIGVNDPIPMLTLLGHSGPVTAIQFSPSGKTILTASMDRSIKVWDASNGRLVRSFNQHTEAVHTLAFRPITNGAPHTTPTAASAGDDRTVRIWQPEIGRMVRIIRNHEGPIFALTWATDGASLFSAGKEGIVRRLSGSSDVVESQWSLSTDWIYALAANSDGTRLAYADWSGNVGIQRLK
jgi:WD40 repeat protein